MRANSSEASTESTILPFSDPIAGSFRLAGSDRHLESGEVRLISSSASPIKGMPMIMGLIGIFVVLLLGIGVLVWSSVYRSREQSVWSDQTCPLVQEESSIVEEISEFIEQENPLSMMMEPTLASNLQCPNKPSGFAPT
jgi:uncharacterized protein YqhQ